MHPPRPPLALTIGITGHRKIAPGQSAPIGAALDRLFARIAARVTAIGAANADVFANTEPDLTLVSPLAEGADQIAAEAALRAGFRLQALQPFAADEYRKDFAGTALEKFDELLAKADRVCALPATRALGPRGYILAGEVTIAQADILVAIWDGAEARGPGGTADIVELAIRRATPVIHLHSEDEASAGIIWSGFDEIASEYLRRDDIVPRPLDSAALDVLIDGLVAPPYGAGLPVFLTERERTQRWRVEWPMMLAMMGVQMPSRRALRASGYADAAAEDWQRYREGTEPCCGPLDRMERLESSFAWADGLAQHYAHVFRSGVVLNFAGAALAVILSLLAFPLPGLKEPLLVAELLTIGAVIANTWFGTRQEWHRRWLDYRFLAEQLRPLRSLKLLGAGSITVQVRIAPQRWTHWYAQAIWRTLGVPLTLTPAAHAELTEQVASLELDGQVAYHRATAHRMHTLDHRLHLLGMTLFILTILIGAGTLVGLVFAYSYVKPVATLLGMLSAALPTLGAAIFGIRAAGDFAGTAARSRDTATHLAHIAGMLRRSGTDHGVAARSAEEAAATMLADLAEWRTSYRHRKLAIPS